MSKAKDRLAEMVMLVFAVISVLLFALLGAAIFCGLCMKAFAEETNSAESASVKTNTWVVSNTIESKAWTRQAVLATPSNTIMDLSGVFVGAAEASVQSNAAERVSEVSQAAIEGVRASFASLYAVTGQVPKVAYHVSLSIAPQSATKALQGYVVKEETDGVTDTQWVWYSHALPAAPIRRVEYVTPSGRFSQSVVWDTWNATGVTVTASNGRVWEGCHRCTVTRPVSARNIPGLTRKNERFGGANGFDFGSALVTVGGRPTRTGSVTNDITGEVWRFDNGVLQTEVKEVDE